MAYRFVLEVPESERRSAEVAVGSVPDTQIVVTRSSFAEGIDQPFAALTIASQNLRIIEAIYDWYGAYDAGVPDARIVLLGGQRIPLADHTSGSLVAAIRTDQPWVEHTVPRIGDHVEESAPAVVVPGNVQAPAPAPRSVTIEQVNLISINVMDLRRAEEFYREFFDLRVVGRSTTDADGSYRILSDDYDWERAIVSETMADDTYVRNGPVLLGLHRVGSGARLDRNPVDRISLQVDGASYRRIKAKVLVNSLELLSESQASFIFRDPFGMPWEVALPGFLSHLLQESLAL